MKNITVKSQKEFDAIPVDFNGRIYIEFGTPFNRAVVNRKFQYASVVARENSSVEARENSSVEAWENSSVVARENSSVVARGNSQICDCTDNHDITTHANSRVVYKPRNADEYCEHFSIERVGNLAKLYKAVHKKNGRYFSDYDENFEYIVGEAANALSVDYNTAHDCGRGLHVAHKEWCVDYGKEWEDLAIIEVEVAVEKIIVPDNSSGKVRTNKLKVVREVPLEECGLLGKILAKKKRG